MDTYRMPCVDLCDLHEVISGLCETPCSQLHIMFKPHPGCLQRIIATGTAMCKISAPLQVVRTDHSHMHYLQHTHNMYKLSYGIASLSSNNIHTANTTENCIQKYSKDTASHKQHDGELIL